MDRLQTQSAMTASFKSNEKAGFVCLPGTRVNLREKLIAWSDSDSSDTKSIFWVSGMAGMGKSTIARTVAGHFDDLGHLVASFFFSRGHEAERRDATKLFNSIAWQLAEASPMLKRWICDAISKNGSILWDKDLARQWDQLIKQPLQELEHQKNFAERVQRPTVVLVVDALDECTDENGIKGFLSVLKHLKDINVVRFRVLITSRDETVILDGMKKLEENIQKCNLAAISQTEADENLHAYYEHELGRIKRAYLERRETEESENQGRIRDPQAWPKLDSWPEEADVTQLVKKTNGLFQYAKTACEIIGSADDTPDFRLKLVLESSLDELDDIYAKALELATPSSKADRTNFPQRFRQVVGVIVLSFDSLSSWSIKCLLEDKCTHGKFNHKVVNDILNRLRSVLYIPEGADSVVTVVHTSFRDFLIDPARCTETEFQIKEEEGHERLFHRCIAVMEKVLGKNICNLESPGTRIVKSREKADGSEVVDTSDIFECIAPHVRYACRFWVDHLLQVKNKSKLFEVALRFLRGHFLHWLEALGLIGKISEGITAITSLESNSKVSNFQQFE